MRRLGLLIASLVFGLMLLIVGARGLGGITSGANQVQALGFDLCAHKPCFSGIVPETTAYSDVQRLAARWPIRSEPIMRLIISLDRADVAVIGHSDQEAVQAIQATLLTLTSPPLAGDLIGLFGLPCRLDSSLLYTAQSAQGIFTINLVYPDMIALIQPVSGHLAVNSPVLMINISSPQGGWCQSGSGGVEEPWSGFASLNRYGKVIH